MKPKDQIVFLDAGTLDYGDISLSAFQQLGQFKAYPLTPSTKVLSRVQDADIVITNKCIFDARMLNALKRTKSIHVAATGVNNVDLQAARRCGVSVTNVSGYSTDTVVQFTFAFILALAGSLVPYHQAVRKGRWSRSPMFTLGDYPNMEVAGKTLGIVGYGTIGKKVAKMARSFGMKVLVSRIPGRRYAKTDKSRKTFNAVIQSSDFLSLHAPLSPLTQNLINARVIRKMKKGSFIINMARGGIVNERDLAKALRSGHLGGAACDVLSVEPPPANHVLLKAPNFLMTPHIAWGSRESRKRLVDEIILNIRAFQQGKRRNRVV